MKIINNFFSKCSLSLRLIKKGGRLKKALSIIGPRYIVVGKKSYIHAYSRLECYSQIGGKAYNPKLIIGDNVIIQYFFTCLVAAKVVIGNGTIIASNVLISSENHGTKICDKFFYKQELTVGDVIIGNNCWIGQNVSILPGVHIGDNCIIGTSSVVTKDIPSNSMAVGNPCKVIKKWDFQKEEWVKVK